MSVKNYYQRMCYHPTTGDRFLQRNNIKGPIHSKLYCTV